MNSNDKKLVLFLMLGILFFFLIKNINNDDNEKVANVYYSNELIKTISLNEDSKHTVLGYNGEVVIEVKDNKVRVLEETSKKNLCSKQGYGEIIICLPNKIIIKVEDYDNELDGVVR